MRTMSKALRTNIVHACLEMNRAGLNQGSSGNVSHRIVDGLLITPSGMPYHNMKPADIVRMRFDGAHKVRQRPSSEWRMHRDILQSRMEANAVVHTHSVHCAALAVHERGIPAFHYMVAVAGGKDIRCAPYARFGTQELSDHALSALDGRRACLLGHHGLVCIGSSLDAALGLAIEVETLARMYLHALAIGEPPLLSERQMAEVISAFGQMSYGHAAGADSPCAGNDQGGRADAIECN